MYPSGLLSQIFQPVFTSSSVLHWVQHREIVTCSTLLTLQIADRQIEVYFSMDALSVISWWARRFVCCWQCLMEAAAIAGEGPAILSKSQTKIQPWRGVVSRSLYINPQLPCFKVNRVFHSSEVVCVVKWLGSNAAQTYQISGFTASISSVWKHVSSALLGCQHDWSHMHTSGSGQAACSPL